MTLALAHPRRTTAAPPRRGRSRPARRADARGAALLVVMVAIALLTALAVDLAYEARVSLQIAVNGRDELRAECLAKSALTFSRLVLQLQQQLDGPPSAQGPTQPPGTATPPGTVPAAAGAAQGNPLANLLGGGIPRVQIWSLVPVNSGVMAALFGGAPPAQGPGAGEGSAVAASRFGDFDGAYDAKIDDESNKVNMQLDAGAQSGMLVANARALQDLVADHKWDFLFDREDENGFKASRTDLLVYLHDWVDDNAVGSAYDPNAQDPFPSGFGDENQPYDRGPDRYRAKNSRLDSLDELHLVAGISDAFMAAFGDRLTVYLPREAQINVNSTDPEDELRIARLMAVPNDPMLLDASFPEKLHKAVSDARMGGFVAMKPAQFAAVLKQLGVQVSVDVSATAVKNPFTDRSLVYRIHASGSAGAVTKNIDAVLTFDPKQQSRDAVAVPGQAGSRFIHWRED